MVTQVETRFPLLPLSLGSAPGSVEAELRMSQFWCLHRLVAIVHQAEGRPHRPSRTFQLPFLMRQGTPLISTGSPHLKQWLSMVWIYLMKEKLITNTCANNIFWGTAENSRAPWLRDCLLGEPLVDSC